jgi:hypothetical protein
MRGQRLLSLITGRAVQIWSFGGRARLGNMAADAR